MKFIRYKSRLLAAIIKLLSCSNLGKLVFVTLTATFAACSQSQGTIESKASSNSSLITPVGSPTIIAQGSNQLEESTTKKIIQSPSVSTVETKESNSIAQTSPSDRVNKNGFMMPSKNIYCLFRDASARSSLDNVFLRCGIASRLKPMPPRPDNPSCEFDWGGGLVLPRNKKAQVLCASDSAYSANYPILQYGQTWERAGFTCKSATDGLTCTNLEGQGFFLNREEWKTF